MPDDLRRALEHRRAQRAHEVGKHVLTDEGFDLAAATQELRGYDALLSSIPQSTRQRIILPLAIGLTSLTIAGVLWTVRTGDNQLVLDVNAAAVGMTLESMTALKPVEPIAADRVELNGLESLSAAPHLGPSFEQSEGTGYLEIVGGRSLIRELAPLRHKAAVGGSLAGVPPPSPRLELQRQSENFFQLTFRDLRVQISVRVSGEVRLVSSARPGQARTTREGAFEIPEPIETIAASRGASPATASIKTSAPIRMHDVPVRDLSFYEHQSAATATTAFVSSVEGGSLTLASLGRTVQLPSRARLTLVGSKGRILRLQLDDLIRVSFDGTVDRVVVNGRDVTPTWLEFLYANRPIALLWSGAVFLWGLLWSLKRLIW